MGYGGKRRQAPSRAASSGALGNRATAGIARSLGEVAYHPLYLRGIERFNRQSYFESHEVWETLWINEAGSARLFYKGLIQAAVALHHLTRGNAHGARKLLIGSQRYLGRYRPCYLGLDVDRFLAAMKRCFDDALASRRPTIVPALVPKIELQPPPNGTSSMEENR